MTAPGQTSTGCPTAGCKGYELMEDLDFEDSDDGDDEEETLGSQTGRGLSLIQGILPNPTESSVSIRLSESTGRGSRVLLFSVAGKLVGEWKILDSTVVSFDLSGQPPGIYVVEARDTVGNREVDKLVLK